MMNPAPGNFVSNTNCRPAFPLAGQAPLAGCVFLQSNAATPALNVSLRGDGLGGSGSSTVNELSHPGVREDLLYGIGVPGGERELPSIVDVNMFQQAFGDTVDLPATANAGADIIDECSDTGGSQVALAGGGTDPEGNQLFFTWNCPGVALSNTGVANPMGFFSVSTTTTCRLDVSDLANLESDADTVDVTVVDTTDPGVSCPADLVVECSQTGGTPDSDPAIAGFLSGAAATDTCDAGLPVSDNAPSFFDLGSSNVTFSTSDDSGNTASCSAQVSVVDTTDPMLSPPLDVGPVECTSPQGAVVDYPLPAATDVCDAAPSVGCAPPSGNVFAIGMTTVTCTATDVSLNQTSDDFEVNVVDTTAPTITVVTATPNVLWPPSHRLVPVQIGVMATDVCDGTPTCVISDVISNEADNGMGDGNTVPDWVPMGDLAVALRAERSGGGSGRVYTVEVTCTDDHMNSAMSSVEVTVPHSQGKGKGK